MVGRHIACFISLKSPGMEKNFVQKFCLTDYSLEPYLEALMMEFWTLNYCCNGMRPLVTLGGGRGKEESILKL